MRTIANMANSAFGYTGTVVGVIAVASIAVFNLQGVTAKAQRHWDADVDRIVAKQQEKRRLLEWAALGEVNAGGLTDEDSANTALTTPSAHNAFFEPAKVQDQPVKKSHRQAERRSRHFIPAALVTLPKLATTATASILKLR